MGEGWLAVRTFGEFGGMDTTSLLTAALQLPDLWRVPGVEFRDGADVKRKLRITIVSVQ